LQVAYTYLSPRRIDLFNFMENSDVNSIPVPELFRSADDEYIFTVDNPADIVGNPSGGKRGMWAPFKDNNFQIGAPAFSLRCGAHPCCIATDNY
jgi:hypothetical protein